MQREELVRLRAADSDRERTADELRRAHVEGRIETAELEERLEGCYAAKTYGELDALLADLPRPRERERERRPSYRPRGLRVIPLVALIVALVFAWHAVWLFWWVAIFVFFRSRRHRYRRYPRPI